MIGLPRLRAAGSAAWVVENAIRQRVRTAAAAEDWKNWRRYVWRRCDPVFAGESTQLRRRAAALREIRHDVETPLPRFRSSEIAPMRLKVARFAVTPLAVCVLMTGMRRVPPEGTKNRAKQEVTELQTKLEIQRKEHRKEIDGIVERSEQGRPDQGAEGCAGSKR
ncbi:MAG: hypothetical protein R3F11_11290 [Verrucomicrobiales bacterium]